MYIQKDKNTRVSNYNLCTFYEKSKGIKNNFKDLAIKFIHFLSHLKLYNWVLMSVCTANTIN